jgi:hypothetical protein
MATLEGVMAPPKPDKPSPMQKLKDELVQVIEERDRYKRQLEGEGILPKPKPVWSAEVSTEERRAQNAALDVTPEEKSAEVFRAFMGGFEAICEYVPEMNDDDREEALTYVAEALNILDKGE